MVWLLSLASVVLVSAVSLVGLLLLGFERTRAQQVTRLLVSLAVGSLLGDAFIHLLPDAFERRRGTELSTSLLVLAGILLFFVIEKLIRHRRASGQDRHGPSPARPELLTINIIGVRSTTSSMACCWRRVIWYHRPWASPPRSQ